MGGQPIFQRDAGLSGASGAGAPAHPQLQKATRAIAFAEERSNALRREFGMLWLTGAPSLPEPAREPAAQFVRRMEAVRTRIVQAQRAIVGLKGKGPIEMFATLKQVDAEGLGPLIQGVDEQARALRALLGLAAPATRPPTGPLSQARAAAGAPPTGTAPASAPAKAGFLGMLKKLAEPAAVEPLAAVGASEAGEAPVADPAVGKARQAFDAAFELVQDVLDYVTPRLEVVQVALDTTGLPGRKEPWEVVTKTLKPNAVAAGIPEPHLPWLPPFTKLFYQNMAAVQKAHMAIVQWSETRAMHERADALRAGLETTPATRQGAMLEAFDLGKYRAAVYPISHLHVSFAGVSPLQDFFPSP